MLQHSADPYEQSLVFEHAAPVCWDRPCPTRHSTQDMEKNPQKASGLIWQTWSSVDMDTNSSCVMIIDLEAVPGLWLSPPLMKHTAKRAACQDDRTQLTSRLAFCWDMTHCILRLLRGAKILSCVLKPRVVLCMKLCWPTDVSLAHVGQAGLESLHEDRV